jgi:prophage DNA circulation protein
MKRKQKIALGVAVAAISTLTLLGSGIASANTGGTDLAAKIATKFNLSQTEVQKVVDEFQNEKKTTRDAQRTADLQAKVDAGTITAAQKTLIENKLKEIEADRETNKDSTLTQAERQAKMQAPRAALEKWATDNGIDIKMIMPLGKGHGGMGRGPKA